MIAVTLPHLTVTSEAFYDAVVPQTIPLFKRQRLQGASEAVAQCIAEYRKLASEHRLSEFSIKTTDFGSAQPEDFKSLYGSFLQSTTGVGRQHYDSLMVAHAQRVCPYCGTRKAKTIDHYLPHCDYPQLSITFENLVASCFECNTVKRTSAEMKCDEMLFHPYYETFPKNQWLVAEAVQDPPITVSFDLYD